MSAGESNRREGVLVPLDDVPAHLACGWRLIDDLCVREPEGVVTLSGYGEVVLLAPPEIAA